VGREGGGSPVRKSPDENGGKKAVVGEERRKKVADSRQNLGRECMTTTVVGRRG